MEDCVSCILRGLINPKLHVTGGVNMSPIYYLLTVCRIWYSAGKSIIKDNKYSRDDYLAYLVSETGYDSDEVSLRTLVKSRRTELLYKDDMVVYYACEFDYPEIILWNGTVSNLFFFHDSISIDCVKSLLSIIDNKQHRESLFYKMITAERKDACDIIFASGIIRYSFEPNKLSEVIFAVENGYCDPADIVGDYYLDEDDRDIIEYFMSLGITVEICNSDLELSKWMWANGCQFSEPIWIKAIEGGIEYMEWLNNIVPYYPDRYDLLYAYKTKSVETVRWLKQHGSTDNYQTVIFAIENDMDFDVDAPLPAFYTLSYTTYKYMRNNDIKPKAELHWYGDKLGEFIEAYYWLNGKAKLELSGRTISTEMLTWVLHNDSENVVIVTRGENKILDIGDIELYDKWVAKYGPIKKLSYHRHLRNHQLSTSQ